MVKFLSNYKGQYRIFIFSTSAESSNDYLTAELNVAELRDNKLVFLPENTYVKINEEEKHIFDIFSDGDVLDLNEKGIIYRWFSVVEGDAGFATTSKCNSNCLMCPACDNERRKSDNTSIEQLYTVLKHLPKNLLHFTVTGGEPTLVGEDNFIYLLDKIDEQLPNTKILLLTNGRTLGDSEFFKKFISSKPGNLRVAIPIHGSTAELHDYITQAHGSFNQTLRAIGNLINSGIETELRIVVSKLNCNDITNISHLISSMFSSVSVVNFVGLEMRGNCTVNSEKVLISYREAFEHSKEAIVHLIKSGIDVGLYNFPYCMIDKEFWPLAEKSISVYKSKFYNECEGCELRNECCGIFRATMVFYNPKVYPIVTGDNHD